MSVSSLPLAELRTGVCSGKQLTGVPLSVQHSADSLWYLHWLLEAVLVLCASTAGVGVLLLLVPQLCKSQSRHRCTPCCWLPCCPGPCCDCPAP